MTASYKEVLPFILPDDLVQDELKRRDQKVYEVSKVPPWVSFEQLKESFRGLWSWDIELVRVMNRVGTKTMFVRAAQAPPRDAAIVGQQWMPIRVAPERPKPEVQRMVLYKQGGKE